MAASDADFLFGLENDEGLWADSSQQGPFSRADIESYIANAPANELNGDVRLIICLDDRAIGTLDLFNYTPATPCAEVGIALVKDMRGHGYALQALCQAEEIAKKFCRPTTSMPTCRSNTIPLRANSSNAPATNTWPPCQIGI